MAFDSFFDGSPSKCSSPSMIVNSPPLYHFDTLPSEHPFATPQPSSFQHKRKREDDFTESPSSKCRFLTPSLSQAITSRHSTTSFPSELKRKREDDAVESSPSKRPNLGSTSSHFLPCNLVAPSLPESSAQPPSTQYKWKREDNSSETPTSKCRFFTRSLSQVILTSSIDRFLPSKSLAPSPPVVSSTANSNPSTHPENRFKHQYLYSQMNFSTRLSPI